MSAKKRTSCTQHEKPEEGCNQDELSREKMKEHPTPVDELPPGEENRMIPNNLMSLFALYKADAEDREARLTRIIRSLTKKVESLECDLSTFREEAKKNEERLMKKVSDLSAKLGSASSDLSARIASLPTLLPTPAESSASSQLTAGGQRGRTGVLNEYTYTIGANGQERTTTSQRTTAGIPSESTKGNKCQYSL